MTQKSKERGPKYILHWHCEIFLEKCVQNLLKREVEIHRSMNNNSTLQLGCGLPQMCVVFLHVNLHAAFGICSSVTLCPWGELMA